MSMREECIRAIGLRETKVNDQNEKKNIDSFTYSWFYSVLWFLAVLGAC
jgi:hypothetical protein